MKKLVAFLLFAMMLMTLFAGCRANNGASGDTQQSTAASQTSAAQTTAETTQAPAPKLSGKIVFYTNKTDNVDTTLKDLAQKFMDANPGTEIATESVAGDAYAQKLSIGMASNSMDDITGVDNQKVTKANLPDYFLPIDDLGFTRDNLVFYDSGLSDDGKLYKMTSAVTYWAVVYNKKVFSDCGIAAVPRTIDELYAACEKIKAKGIVPINTNYKDAWPMIVPAQFNTMAVKGGVSYFESLLASNELITADGIGEQFKIWLNLKDKGYLDKDLLSAGFDQCQKDIAQGKSAMTCLGSFAPQMFADQGANMEEIGMFPWPGAPGTYAGPDWYFGIAKNTKNPDLAKAYFKYMWEDGRYADAIGSVSPILGVKSKIPAVNELLSYGTPVQGGETSDAFNAIMNKGEISIGNVLQEYLVSKTPDDVIKKYNQKWADAKKALGK